MYSAYILQSQKLGRYYIGSCKDVDIRIKKHNAGAVRATKAGIPWGLRHREEFLTRSEAVRREKQIKSYKGGEAFRKLVKK
ncbi:MAG: GIY-YIG nuclease family protein [Candidatus Doudnabacteria bacterium]|nr:GIY-YIG nuclease family protein [Candidatus Doudnabacteria bacterium]